MAEKFEMDAASALKEAISRIDCFARATHSQDDPGFDGDISADTAFFDGIKHSIDVLQAMIVELEQSHPK